MCKPSARSLLFTFQKYWVTEIDVNQGHVANTYKKLPNQPLKKPQRSDLVDVCHVQWVVSGSFGRKLNKRKLQNTRFVAFKTPYYWRSVDKHFVDPLLRSYLQNNFFLLVSFCWLQLPLHSTEIRLVLITGGNIFSVLVWGKFSFIQKSGNVTYATYGMRNIICIIKTEWYYRLTTSCWCPNHPPHSIITFLLFII